MGREVAGRLGPAHDRLDELGVVAVGDEGAADDGGEVGGAPGRLLRHLDHDGVAGEESRDHGAHHVVEGIVPANESGHDAERLVAHLVALVGHEEVRRAAARTQCALAMAGASTRASRS